MVTLNSQKLAEKINNATRIQAAKLVDLEIHPHLAVILVGEDTESIRYVDIKNRRGKELGLIVSIYHLEEEVEYEEIVDTISYLNKDDEIHAIILQLPLPDCFTREQRDALVSLIDKKKNVDGLAFNWTEHNQQYLQNNIDLITDLKFKEETILPPISLAVYSLLKEYEIDPRNQKSVVIGRGILVGEPVYGLFKTMGYNVEVVDAETDHILDITKTADIAITGTGQKGLLTYQWFKEGATIIDCAGDIHRDSVEQIVGAISPEKGGIGPLTVAWLLHNTVVLAGQ